MYCVYSIYKCVCVYIYIYTYICICVCTYIHVCECVCMNYYNYTDGCSFNVLIAYANYTNHFFSSKQLKIIFLSTFSEMKKVKKHNNLVLQYVSIATVYEECKLKLIIKKSNWFLLFLKQNTCFDLFIQYHYQIVTCPCTIQSPRWLTRLSM